LKTQQSPVTLDLYLRKSLAGKSHDHRDVIVFQKLRFQIKRKARVLNASSLKIVFETIRFREGLVWTVGVTTEMIEAVF